MAIASTTAGGNVVPIVGVGDPSIASNVATVNQFHLADGQSLNAALYDFLVGDVHLLLNASNTWDRARSAVGTTGITAVNNEGTKGTFSAASVSFTPVATATDFWQIVGSGTKTVRVIRVQISGIATSAATNDVLLIKRTTANTGGTSASVSIAQHDSNDSAATATVNSYSVNPTTGTGVAIRGAKLNLGAAGSAGSIVWDFTGRNDKALVLRGTAQSLNLNWNGNAVPSGTSLDIDIEFTEE